MRTEAEMLGLLLETAARDHRVRVVAMNGSRTNKNAPKDSFQDYDVVYLVTELDSFLADPGWVDCFGERIIMQEPDGSILYPGDSRGSWAYLMLFTDGNRIDLTLTPVDQLSAYLQSDGLLEVLLDKDGRVPPLPEPTDVGYRVKRPDERLFYDCCNEFWWVSPYVVKGLRRGEPLYATDHLDILRRQLRLMLSWQVGIETDFSVCVGKNDKYLGRYLPEPLFRQLLSTCNAGTTEACWASLLLQQQLFREASRRVAQALAFPYPDKDAGRVSEYTKAQYALRGT